MKSIRPLTTKGVNLITFKGGRRCCVGGKPTKGEKENHFIGLYGISAIFVGFLMAMFIWMANLLRRFFFSSLFVEAYSFCLHFNAVADNECEQSCFSV